MIEMIKNPNQVCLFRSFYSKIIFIDSLSLIYFFFSKYI